ncbi:MAG: hypothetical protein K2J25_04355, partial [Oscillospiraceae bacterium]|nr:hypothetical protein [Oscillospiraceae bacterium]
MRRKKYNILQKCTVFGTLALLLTAGAGCLIQYVPVLTSATSEKLNLELNEDKSEYIPDLLQPDFYLSEGFGISEDLESETEPETQVVFSEQKTEKIADAGEKPYPEEWNLTGGIVE